MVHDKAVMMFANARKTTEKFRRRKRSLRRGFLIEFDTAVAGLFAATAVGEEELGINRTGVFYL